MLATTRAIVVVVVVVVGVVAVVEAAVVAFLANPVMVYIFETVSGISMGQHVPLLCCKKSSLHYPLCLFHLHNHLPLHIHPVDYMRERIGNLGENKSQYWPRSASKHVDTAKNERV